jgi:hypothetical protein
VTAAGSPSSISVFAIPTLDSIRSCSDLLYTPLCSTACVGPSSPASPAGGPTPRAALGLASLAARRVLPCHDQFRRFASRLPAVLSPLAGVRQHPVEVATEAEPLSLSIARACVLLSRLSVFSLLPCLLRARLWHSLP